jgi:uncharacterized protein YlxW (UPF0749 family)
MRTLGAQISLTIVCLLLGVALVVQFRTQGNIVNKILVDSSTEQATIINGLVQSNADLRKEIDALDAQLNQYQQGQPEGNIQSLAADLNRIKAANGLIEVSGPGVELVLGGPLAPEELQDVINELRNAGAEAIVLNGERVVVNSVVSLDRGGATLDGQPLVPPYDFLAIGDPETLAPAVDRKGGLVPALLANHPGLQMKMQKRDKLVAPIFDREMEFRYARPVVNQ